MTPESWFEQTFGAPLPLALPTLVQTPGAHHWVSQQWANDPSLSPNALMVPAFPDQPERYTVIGHWGHGLGSQAFYFVHREPEHRCFLRVGFGGPYDPPSRAGEIVRALSLYRELRALPGLHRSEVVYSIGSGRAEVETPNRIVVDGPHPVDELLRLVMASCS